MKKLEKENVQELLGLSMIQSGMLFHYLKDTNDNVYNVQLCLGVEGDLDINTLAGALQAVQFNNEILRSVFRWENIAKPVQAILQTCPIDINYLDISKTEKTYTGKFVEQYIQNDSNKRFDLGELPLRISVLKTGEKQFVLVLTHHHILYDGWSTGILLKELFDNYYHLQQQAQPLPVIKPAYKDVVLAAQKNNIVATAASYWKEVLKEYTTGLLFSTTAVDTVRNLKKTHYSLSQTGLDAFAKKHHVTKSAVIYAAYGILLQQYLNSADVTFGTTVSNRAAGYDDVMGNFINTIPLRVTSSNNDSLLKTVLQLNTALAERNQYLATSYHDIKQLLALKPSEDLFDSVVVIENYPIDESITRRNEQLKIKLLSVYENTGIPLLVSVYFREEIEIELAYSEPAACSFDLQVFGNHFVRILQLIIAAPNQLVAEVNFLTETEKDQILSGFNNTKVDYTKEETVISLFEKSVERFPENIALRFDNGELTYRQLNEQANKIAAYLIQEQQVRQGSLIGVLLQRDEYLIPVIYGILKAGAVYIPLDPRHPARRIASVIEDARLNIILTRTEHKTSIALPAVTTIDLDEQWSCILQQPGENINSNTKATDPAYVLYTSGSTGIPKGVLVEHSSLLNIIQCMDNRYPLDSKGVYLFKTTHTFDVSLAEIFGWSHAGGSLAVLLPGNSADAGALLHAIEKFKVTHINFVPSLFSVFVDELEQQGTSRINSLRYIFLAGEALPAGLVNRFNKLQTGIRLENIYGPTEATIYSCGCSVTDVKEGDKVLIGKPLDNIQLYILNEQHGLKPIGAAGELYIAGNGLARGYLHNDTQTAARFVPNPFRPGERMYRTGDLVKWTKEGSIEYLGRLDNQVKIRGFRIETGDIEQQVNTHDGVKESAVVVRENAVGKYLVAYVVATKTINKAAWKAYLQQRLPEYMIPSFFVELPQLPLSSSGKLDRKQLPEPEIIKEAYHTSATNAIQETLVEIWSSVLNVPADKISTNANFFDIGGDSIKLISVSAKIRKAFNKEISVARLFDYPSITRLAGFIGGEEKITIEENEIKPVSGNTDIAIIGMAGRFPGAADIRQFWKNLSAGKESITRKQEKQPGDALIYAKGQLADYDCFDADFFNYLPSEALLMDPQVSIFHECTWQALENAGYDPAAFRGKIGLYGGASMNPFYNLHAQGIKPENWMEHWDALTYSDKDFLCPRVSYRLNLKGPSINITTACSTSLVAVDTACTELLAGKCYMAVAGGISVTLHDNDGYAYEKDMILSPDGTCRAFDEKAAGTIGGNGVAVIVLKKLDDAIRDGDYIHAVIKATATNNDGNEKIGFTAPGIEGQSTVIKSAINKANIPAESITYIETHGTGTTLGDPIEIAGLTRAFGTAKKQFCAIGSVKTNIGHLDAAAGVAGLVKTVLALQHRQLPPSLHYKNPNPKIDFANSPFFVNTELKEWKSNGYPLRAGVSSFGIGGTNAHVILEEAPQQVLSSKSRTQQLLLFSAKTPAALQRNIENFRSWLKDNDKVNLADVAYTLQTGRAGFAYRQMLVCDSTAAAMEQLPLLQEEDTFTQISLRHTPEVVFMFSGQGSQYAGMCKGLYETEPVFKQEVDRCCAYIQQQYNKDLLAVIFPKNEEDGINIDNTEYTQPALFVIEYALATLLQSWGIQPAMMIGHSIGEYVAACISGVFSYEDALKLVVKRGELMQKARRGKMLSVSLNATELSEILKEHPEVNLAAINSSRLCAVSGTGEAIQNFQQSAEQAGHVCRPIRTSHAFHSYMMEEILDEYRQVVSTVVLHSPQQPFISNLTGDVATTSQVTTINYWVDHLRQTVQFSKGIETLMAKYREAVFIEVGPGKVLSSLVQMHEGKEKGHQVVNLVRQPKEKTDDIQNLLQGIGNLWLNGISVNWSSFYKEEQRRKVSLPTYSFEKTKYSKPQEVFSNYSVQQQQPAATNGIMNFSEWFYVPGWKKSITTYTTPSTAKKTTVLFVDDEGIGKLIIKALQHHNETVLTIKSGKHFKQAADGWFINPGNEQDYKRLVNEIAEKGMPVDRVIHAWGISKDREEIVNSSLLDKSFYSLFYIAKALNKQKEGFAKEIVVITNDAYSLSGDENYSPVSSMSRALLTVLPQEYPGYTTKQIDVSIDDRDRKDFISKLYTEIIHTGVDKTCCLRKGNKWIPVYDTLPVQNTATSFREEGVYLITGGLGNVGFTLAEYLVKKYRANVILLGQTKLTDEETGNNGSMSQKLRRLTQLQTINNTSHVQYYYCNIADGNKVKIILGEAKKRFGKLNGVIHAAGIIEGQSTNSVDKLTKEDFENQFAAKLEGVQVLAAALKEQKLDFVIATSSLASLLGGVGFSAYAAANIFMDNFIASGREKGELENWLSINLDGINFTASTKESRIIDAHQLCEVIETALQWRAITPQVLVSKTNLQKRLEGWVNTTEAPEVILPQQDIAGLTTATGKQDVEQQLQQLWVKFFGKPLVKHEDNFFETGGDSMMALRMIGRIHKAFNIELTIRDFFDNPSFGELVTLVKNKLHIPAEQQSTGYATITRATGKEYYPVTSIQQRLYFLHQFDNRSLSYNMTQLFGLKGAVDKERLTNALNTLVNRHDSLRTAFEVINEQVVQKIEKVSTIQLEYYTVEDNDTDKITLSFVRPFDLSKAPLIRAGLFSLPGNEHILIIDMHHIITDGVSKNILTREFISLYKGEELNDAPLQYIDYVEWLQKENTQPRTEKQKAFWLDQFREEIIPLDLPVDYTRPLIKTEAGNTIEFALTSEEVNILASLAEKESASLFMVLLSVYNILLAKITNQEDIVVGTPASGRRHPDMENIAGLFLNTLPLRNYPKGELSVTEFLAAVKAVSLAGFENQEYPYEELIEALHLDRDTGRNPLFDVWFMYQQREQAIVEMDGLTITPIEHQSKLSKFDCSLEAFDDNGNINLRFEYATALFNETTIHSFIGYFRKIIAAIGANSNIRIADIEIVSGAEKSRLLHEFNNTQYAYSTKETIVSLFQQQVLRTPGKTALVYEGKKLTYKELDELSDRVGHSLRTQYQIRPNDIIAILADRSEKMIVSLFGILKSGAAYLPIDPQYPADRINYMLEDSGAEVLLLCEPRSTDIIYNGRLAEYDRLVNDEVTDLPVVNRPSDLCYVIYTSGSTGKPKGVKICHRNVVNFMAGMNKEIPVSHKDCMLAVTSTSFDISVLEIFWTLCHGVEVVLHPSDISMNGLDRYIARESTSMDFSLFFFSSYKNDDPNKYNLLLQSVKYADEAGFKAVWTPERHFHEFGGLYPNPSVTSAALAAITQKIELRSGSVVSPLHDPIRIAEEWSVVDNLSGGRVGLSFASGWNPNDFVLAKDSYKERQKIMYEQIELVKKLWRGETVKRENGVGKETEVHIYPLPVQKELPVWITSGGNEETFKSAGAAGANLLTHFLGQDIAALAGKIKLYREARAQHGYNPEDGKITIMLHTFVGRDENEVEQIVEQPFTEYLKSSIGLNKILSEELGLQDGTVADEVMNNALKSAFKRYYKTSSLIGTKSKCAEMVLRLKEIGVDEIGCLIDFGVAPAVVLKSLQELNDLKQLFSGRLAAHSPITMLQSTPSFIRMVEEGLGSKKFLQSLRLLLIGGDMLPVPLVNQLQKETNAVIYNMYGPTETTIWSCMHRFEGEVKKISVGKPMANQQVYILNNYLQLVPAGVPGELYIGGDGVSEGYLNRGQLTIERFIANPFSKSGKLYKTGDLARWLPNGTIELLGRADNQVKIRGYRIELGEIETRLLAHEEIKEVVVVARGSENNKYLAAYYVSSAKPGAATLRNHLLQNLPDYMVPSFFVQLEQLPLTSNGKLDRKALPEPGTVSVEEYTAPVTGGQQLLAEIWSKVLGVERIGIKNNFFSAGGDSIKSIQIIARLRAAGYELTVKDIFTSQTIEALAPRLKPITKQSDQSMVTGEAMLSPMQQWFFDKDRESPHHYNQAVMLHFEKGLSHDTVKQIFEKLQQHHDGLRTVFKRKEQSWQARILPAESLTVSINECDLRNESNPLQELKAACDKVQSNIDLANGPLMRLGLFHLPDGSRLLIAIHHLVIDGISWRILFEDIQLLYDQLQKDEKLNLPLKTDAFQHWPAQLLQYSNGKEFEAAMGYWNTILNKSITPIVRDNANGQNRVQDGVTYTLRLPAELTGKLLTQVHAAYHTQINDVLLAGFLSAMHQCFGTQQVKIDMEGHGRETILPGVNISRTTGWFTSIYPVLLAYSDGPAGRLLKTVKENLRQVPHNGIDYLLAKYMAHNETIIADQPAQIMFNYLGQFDADTQDKSYRIAKESPGEMMAPVSQRDYDWEIVGMVTAGELQMNITYSAAQYNESTITNLMERYRQQLEALVNHCCSRSEQELTPSDLTARSLTMDQVEVLQQRYSFSDIYNLSPMQEGILLHAVLDNDPELFFVQVSYDLQYDQLDIAAVERSLNELVKRYDVLRTTFVYEGYERPLQLVLREHKAAFSYNDISEQCKAGKQVLASYLAADKLKGFNPGKEVPMRLSVYRTGESSYTFAWSYHHLLMDGWCMSLLINDFKKLYIGITGNKTISLPAVKPYAHYIKWLEGLEKENGLQYWKQYIAGYETLSTLPKKQFSPEMPPYQQATASITFNKAQREVLQQATVKYGVTLSTIMQAAWGILLGKYNNTNDVLFGSVVSGRPAVVEGVEDMVGLFINTVPVRITTNANDTVATILGRLQKEILESEPYHYHSLAEIQSVSSLGRNLLDHVVVFENYPIAQKIESAGSSNKIDAIQNLQVSEQNNYQYNITIIPGTEIVVRLDYNANRYDSATMELLLLRLQRITEQLATHADLPVADISIVTAAEEHQLVDEFNNTNADYPADKHLIDVFEEQVAKTPDSIAVVYEGRSITYAQLQEQSDKIAFYLKEQLHVLPGDLVGLLLLRSEYLMPSILAILKTGAAYVPVDPNFPSARITTIVADAGLKAVITSTAYAAMPALTGSYVLDIQEKWNTIQQQPAERFPNVAEAKALAYVIYTSGSTGKPKGVMIEHHSVLNRILWMQKQYPITSADVLLQKTPVVFDVSVWELFWWFFTGSSLCVLKPEAEKDPEQLIDAIEKNRVSVIHFVPSMLAAFLSVLGHDFNYKRLSSLQKLFASGEALKPVHVDTFGNTLHQKLATRLINLYGPTEATVDVSYYECEFEQENKLVPIGKPIDNVRLHIIDKNGRLAPVGIAGELCIAGVGLARGYLNNEPLTQQKFITPSFLKEDRIYKTGDLARWLPDGNIEYLGRLDHQIKLRGYRIETEEIELALNKHPQIKESVVLLLEKGEDKYLVAYYVSEHELGRDLLHPFLLKQLPEYMIPSFFIPLQHFPISINGKLDRKSLPEPEITGSRHYIKPSGEIEEKLVEIWADVLRLDKNIISVNQNFFELGGHSLKATVLINKINKTFDAGIPLGEIFNKPNIGNMAEHIIALQQRNNEEKSFENAVEIVL